VGGTTKISQPRQNGARHVCVSTRRVLLLARGPWTLGIVKRYSRAPVLSSARNEFGPFTRRRSKLARGDDVDRRAELFGAIAGVAEIDSIEQAIVPANETGSDLR